MKKEIKKWGDSAVIVFTKEELRIYNLKIGEVIDFEIKLKQEENKNGIIQ